VGGLAFIQPVSIAVATLLALVVISYRQTVKAYPTGGGAYRVSHENLGMFAGLLAASALLIDYVLTVSVSVTAGVEAMTSLLPSLHENALSLAFLFIGFVTLLNLRGVKESGTIFAIPTYGFVASIYLMIATGIFKCLSGCPQAESASLVPTLHVEHALGIVLLFRAFAAGTTALTGVEAIADGVPAFRYPQSKNAATTLTVMAVLSISMFLGISFLADQTNVVYVEGLAEQRSVVAQVAFAIFNGGPLFAVVQIMSAAILVLAANTAYQDFPRLSSILAQDRFMPRQFMNRGDRLVFSNGILILAVLAGLLIWVFDANLTHLIQLYLIGVFISFTLSQTGMVLRARRLKPPGWKRTQFISGFGAIVTGSVLIVIGASKFRKGAWIVMVAIPILMFVMRSIYVHYTQVRDQLRDERRKPVDRRLGHQHMVILVQKVDAASARAVGIVRSIRPNSVTAITRDPTLQSAWRRLAPEIEMETLPSGGSSGARIREFLRTRRSDLEEDDFLTLVVPEILYRRGLLEIATRSKLHRLKRTLMGEPGVQVLDVPMLRAEIDPAVDESRERSRNFVCVLVSGVQNATLQAIEYAETLRPSDLRAVSFGLDPQQTETLGERWLSEQIPIPLEIEAAPFRDIGRSVIDYVRQFQPDGVERMVTVVLPEFVVKKPHHQLLHGQTALLVKRHLLFEPGVVVASVPYQLER
jgi:amino acid transporter